MTNEHVSELVRRHWRDLSPAELKTALCIWMRLDDSGGDPVDFTIPALADATGLSARAVQTCRAALIRRGAVGLISGPHERSRYAWPSDTDASRHSSGGANAVPVPATTAAVPSMTAEEEIARLIAEWTTAAPDPQFVAEAERIAGSKAELLRFLQTIAACSHRRLSPASALSRIAVLAYQTGGGPKALRHR